jgi:hypothetical protein
MPKWNKNRDEKGTSFLKNNYYKKIMIKQCVQTMGYTHANKGDTPVWKN